MAVGRVTSKQFREMGITLPSGEVVTFQEHLNRIFKPAFEAHAHEFAAIFAGRKVDWPFPEKEPAMKLAPVTSSNIAAIGHDPEKSELHVKFKSGATHAYSGVSEAEHAALMGAESVGSHFHKNIRSKPNRKVE